MVSVQWFDQASTNNSEKISPIILSLRSQSSEKLFHTIFKRLAEREFWNIFWVILMIRHLNLAKPWCVDAALLSQIFFGRQEKILS